MTFRNPQYLALAQQAPHCMDCGSHNDGTITPAHANHIDKGMGIKAPDWAWAALCCRCHSFLDQGAAMNRDDRRAMWLRAFFKTQTWLWTSGLICVAAKPAEHVNPPKPPGKKIAKGRPLQSARTIKSRNEWPEGRKIAKRPWPARAS